MSARKQIADNFIGVLKNELTKSNKVATGKTISSIHPRFTVGRDTIEIEVYGNKSILHINDGRKPTSKAPPKGSLKDWLHVRSIPQSASFIIRRSIGKKGIKAVPVLDNAKKKVERMNKRLVVQYLKEQIMEQAINQLLNA